ncbi:MAG: P1 family peptidase [Propionibacteriaceae bacterium]
MIDGFAIGHHTADGDGWLTGATVVLADGDGATGGVDVRGGGPGTRETDLLKPDTLVQKVNAVLLTGGSAYGLAAADGVMAGLEELRLGFPVGPRREHVVPIVPAAVIFDLGRGGQIRNRPTADFGRAALAAARPGVDPDVGCFGVGTGARCGGLKGGFGYAESVLADGIRVGVAVVVNATGAATDPRTGRLWSDRTARLRDPTEAERRTLTQAESEHTGSLATTLGVVLTDATLTKAQAGKVAAVAHDGLARSVVPVHAMTDGDTIFTLASCRRPAPDSPSAQIQVLDELLAVAAAVFTDACCTALLAATSRRDWPSYTSLAPSCLPA